MMNENDLRLPLPPCVLENAGFDHVQHVGVAIVVVSYVLLVEKWKLGLLVRRSDILHVPVGDHLLSVRVDGRPQHEDDVVENGSGTWFRGSRQQGARERGGVLTASHSIP